MTMTDCARFVLIFSTWIVTFLISVAATITWHVSYSGIDTASCGRSKDIPCASIDYVITMATDHDVINIDGSDNMANWYPLCDSDAAIAVNKSLKFEGVNGSPRIGCTPKVTNDTILSFQNMDTNQTEDCLIIFQSLIFENGVLSFGNCTVEIMNVTFQNASIHTGEICTSVSMYISMSSWQGRSQCNFQGDCQSTLPNRIVCDDTDISIHRTRFMQSVFLVDSKLKTMILISEITVHNADTQVRQLHVNSTFYK